MSERPTKERILDAAEEIMLERSFHSVGLNQILAAVKVPKGSFYHYFESKEQFGVEMLRHYMADASAYKRRFLLSSEVESNPVERLLTFFEAIMAKFHEHGGKCPCLVLKLASEVADFSEPMREELARGFAEWVEMLRTVLEEAVTMKLLPEILDAESEAALIHDLWSGALQRAAIYRNPEPIRQALTQIRARLAPASA